MAGIKVYFDMDGVLCDWVQQYESKSEMPLEDFSALTREEREVIKQDLFNYDFFRTMKPLRLGMETLKLFIDSDDYEVCILSATGRVNKEEVLRAKKDWIADHIGEVDSFFVDKVETKSVYMDENFEHNILIDDRESAIEAWEQAGGIGVLFNGAV